MAKDFKKSETIEIRRSQIKLNPLNPKQHTDKKINEQKRNFAKFGYLGGVVWNRTTGNLIDGHRRIRAMDLHYGYDGTPTTDYTIKVEAVAFDEKQEKEQMTYMALGNSKADYQLIAEYYKDIDLDAAGISDYDRTQIEYYLPTAEDVGMEIETIADIIAPTPPVASPAERKAEVKEAKAAARDRAIDSFKELDAYITISFTDSEQKRQFCELVGVDDTQKFIPAEIVLNMFE